MSLAAVRRNFAGAWGLASLLFLCSFFIISPTETKDSQRFLGTVGEAINTFKTSVDKGSNIIGIGLLFHMLTDFIDCLMTNSSYLNPTDFAL